MASLDLRNPIVQKIVLTGVLVAGVVGVFFFTHFLPFNYQVQRTHLDALKAEYEKKSTELARARATVADLPRFEAKRLEVRSGGWQEQNREAGTAPDGNEGSGS